MKTPMHFRPFTSEQYPCLTELTNAYNRLHALIELLQNLTHFGKPPGTVDTDPLDDSRTKNGKMAELPLRLRELPDLQQALRLAIKPVQSMIDEGSTDRELVILAEFNVWGACSLLGESEDALLKADHVMKTEYTKTRAAIDAAYNVAARTTTAA